MIRFILKNEQGEYRTVAVNSAELKKLLHHNFEIVGQERMEEFYAKINASVITANKIRAHEEPQFPEKYTPVIVKDHIDSVWTPDLFLQKESNTNDLWFDCASSSWKLIAPLMGNESLIDTNKQPPFYWKGHNASCLIVKS